MIIKLSPQRRDGALTLARAGDVLVINGTEVDLSGMTDGERRPPADEDGVQPDVGWSAFHVDDVTTVTVVMPIGPNPSDAQAFPEDIIDPPDGPIALPV